MMRSLPFLNLVDVSEKKYKKYQKKVLKQILSGIYIINLTFYAKLTILKMQSELSNKLKESKCEI